MEKVYTRQQLNFSHEVNLKEHFELFSNKVNFINDFSLEESEQDEEIFNLMGIKLKQDTKDLLKDTCSFEHLAESTLKTIPNDKKGMKKLHDSSLKHIPLEAKSLETIKNLEANVITKNRSVKEYTDFYVNGLKYRSQVEIDDTNFRHLENLKENDEILLFIRIYAPFRYIPGFKTSWIPRFSHEIIVSGSNTVQDFCKKILCPSDENVSYDISENPDNLQPTKGKYKSCLIFIHDTLYHNAKDSNYVDYSEVVMEFSKNLNYGVGPFKKELMDNVLFKDLKLKLGYPYMYQHQGDCEHLFTISDIRLIHSSDSLCSEDYPRFACASNKITRRCMMCGTKEACYIVRNCDRIPSDPAYMCEICFKSYLYIDGKKVGNFKAYVYFESSYVC
ncbi:snRNA-activating protein complex subunit 3 [Chrysoperla carnea]|uniref:snRNA-activating protein complex subunit 3 n=1 Tax=Chrysoperla carnea TaxID=189513 RepID=UPI001D0818E0|nr:snRNA-activating protein complex subunit 3 [Chrysoperla carnea]